MCIIVAKEKGIEIPSKEILETCFRRNPDGAGFMYVKDNKVIIDKGYMDFKSFYKRLTKLDKKLKLKDKALVMHFRIGTHGKNDRSTTHPFPISNNDSDLKQTYFTTDLGMAHNGIIPKYDYEEDMSDTQLFIRDVVSILKGLNKKFYKNKETLDMLKRVCTSKLAFLDVKENIIYVGDFVKDDNGVRYSNTTYKPLDYACLTYYDSKWKDYEYPTTYHKNDYLYDEYEDPYEDYEEYEIEDFVRNKDYTLLKRGDLVEMSDSTTWEVEENDTYFYTGGDIYEYYGGYLSLIATDTILLKSYNDYQLRGCAV